MFPDHEMTMNLHRTTVDGMTVVLERVNGLETMLTVLGGAVAVQLLVMVLQGLIIARLMKRTSPDRL